MSAATDKAVMTITSAILPDEMRKTLTSLSMEYTPADDAEAWYSNVKNIDATSRDLIVPNMYVTKTVEDGTATYGSTRGNTAATVSNTVAVATDKIKFLFIQHLSVQSDGTSANTNDSIYVNFDAGTAAHSDTSAFEIGPGESWFCKPGCAAADVHAICALKAKAGTSSSTIQCLVAAIIEDSS
jgi:hypothetical protein